MILRNKSITRILSSTIFFVATIITTHATSITEQISQQMQSSKIKYILSFDGGGSKTALQILNSDGEPITLYESEKPVTTITGGSSNINAAGNDEVRQTILSMARQFMANPDRPATKEFLVVGGFAGAGNPKNVDLLKDIFKSLGFLENNIIITSDAAMCLEAVDQPGIIVIAGTGCICFGKKGTEQFRVGGLGPRIDNGGSGYHVGKAAIKAALENAYGWGMPTTLTELVKEHFQVTDLKDIIAPINQAKIPVQQIAQLSQKVFAEAAKEDIAAKLIFEQTAEHLGHLINTMVFKYHFDPCPIYFFGGLFKSSIADDFIRIILHTAGLIGSWETRNQSHINPTTMVIQRAIRSH